MTPIVLDDVLVQVREGAVSVELVYVPVVDSFAGVAHETADGFADAISEAEHSFPVVHESGDGRVYFGEVQALRAGLGLGFLGFSARTGRLVAVRDVRAVAAIVAVFIVVVSEIVEDHSPEA